MRWDNVCSKNLMTPSDGPRRRDSSGVHTYVGIGGSAFRHFIMATGDEYPDHGMTWSRSRDDSLSKEETVCCEMCEVAATVSHVPLAKQPLDSDFQPIVDPESFPASL